MGALDGNRIVQLPQSITFGRKSGLLLAETQRIFRRSEIDLFCRDRESLQTANQLLGVPARLCPDLAFGIGRLKPSAAVTPVLGLLRTDLERKTSVEIAGVVRADWRDSPAVMRWRRGGRLLDILTRRSDPSGAALSFKVRRWLAQGKVNSGARLISRGRFLITDRLHGHILAVLLGLPHAILDNKNGKVSAYWRAWTSELSFARLAGDLCEAVALARQFQRPDKR
jgi:pyruvyl transferase EpsO